MNRTFFSFAGTQSVLRLVLLVALSATFACGSCGDDPVDKDDLEPALLLEPTNQDFGSLAIGVTSEPVTFTMSNVGDGESSALTVAVTGSESGDFEIVDDTCDGQVLAPDASCTVDVTFTPGAEGARQASLEFTTEDDSRTANLTGTGTAPGSIAITPTPHDFGDVTVGESSAAMDFTVTNGGGSETGELTANLSAGDAVEFSVTDDGCSTTTLAVDATCTISVVFAPNSEGMKSTTLRVVGGPNDGEATAALNGNAIGGAELSIPSDTQDFGDVSVGETSSDATLAVTNNGGGETGAIATTLGGADAADFTVVTDGCDGQALAGGDQCEIVVNFTPSTEGAKTATLDITAMPGGTVSYTLTGNGVTAPSLVITPNPADFGTAPVGQAGPTVSMTVENTGGTATGGLNTSFGGTNPGDFGFVAGANGCQGVTLAAGDTCTTTVQFSPSAPGARSADLTVSAGALSATAVLNGTGQSPAVLAVNPTAQGFGSVEVNTTSNAVTFTVSNSGMQTSGALSVARGGTNPDEFTIVSDGCSGVTLDSTTTCVIDVAFAPTVTGASTATLDISGTPGGTASADLDGTGIVPANISPDATALTFGDVVNNGTSNTQTVVITNDGTEPTPALTTAITGDFVTTTNGCEGTVLDAGESCTITVEFAPTVVGAATGSLDVDAGAAGTLQISLSGTSLPEFTFAPAAPDPYDYGSHTIGDANPPTQVFTITNTTGAGEQSRDITATLGASGDFTVVANTCDGSAVAPGDTCTIEVEFDPVGPPGDSTATISATDQTGATHTRGLTGTAVSNVPLDISPTSHDFVDQSAGTTDTVTFTVTNTTNAQVGPLQTVFSANGGPFGIVADTCAGATLDAFGGANDSCEVTVIFFPQSPSGFADATLMIDSPTESTQTVTIGGNAINPPTLTIDNPAFAATVISTNTTDTTYTVENTGSQDTGTITVSLTGSAIFTTTSDDCTGNALAPGETCTVTVEAAPDTSDAAGDHTATLSVTADPGDTFDREITTEVLSQLVVDSPASPFTFDDTVVNDSSDPITFIVRNQSQTAVSTAPTVDVTAPFTLDDNQCNSIPAGGICSVAVTFDPTVVADDQGGTLAVGSGASGTATWDLLGTAAPDAVLAFDPQETDFGYATVNEPGVLRTYVLRNTGGLATATTPAFTFNPNNNVQFTVDTSNCSSTLAADATCNVDVRFTPDQTGQANLEITATADGQSGASVSDSLTVTGEGRADSNFILDPRSYQFMETPVAGDTSTEKATFTVTNTTGSAVNNLNVTISNGEFSLEAGQDNCTGQNLPNNQSCTFRVEFTPTAVGDQTATVTVRRGGTQDSARLFGTSGAPAELNFTSGDPDFGNVISGNAVQETFVLTNVGDQPTGAITSTIFGTGAGQYDIVTDGCSGGLNGGQTCDLVVEFVPNAVATFDATLQASPNAGSDVTLDLTGNGVTGGVLELTPDSAVDCGDQVAAEASVPCPTFTLTNTGGATSADFDLFLDTGVDFEIDETATTCTPTGTTPAWEALAGGATCDVVVNYTPDAPSGSDVDVLNVDDGSSTDTIDLSGDATRALSASVNSETFTAPVGGSDSATITYTNASGTPPTGALNVSLSGGAADEYSVAGDCVGATLDGGETCTLTVTFIPSTVDTGLNAVLSVGDGTTNKTSGSVSLSGEGTN